MVDERSIEDVTPNELTQYTQCHFFAGIGIWSHALRLAGWPDDRPVWTGSCPCQPFSDAGKGAGTADERHLWPAFHHLIRFCKPGVVFGEQVASRGGLGWLDIVQADMEAEGYAFGAVDLCAAGFGAPHIRQRLFFVADGPDDGGSGLVVDAAGSGRPGRRSTVPLEAGSKARSHAAGQLPQGPEGRGSAGQLVHAAVERLERHTRHGDLAHRPGRLDAHATRHSAEADDAAVPGPTNGFWAHVDWLRCRDDKWRPVEAGTFPLADGNPGRMGRLRGYGNAISPWPAKAVIEAYQDSSIGAPR